MSRRLPGLFAAVALVLAPVAAQQAPTFSAQVEGVRVDVLVTEDGRALSGLGPADFDVRDNGVPQHIDLVDLTDVPVNVVLTLDFSRSVTGDKLAALRRAGRGLLDGLSSGDQAALVTFSTAVTERVPMTADIDRVRAALDGGEPSGDTALVDAAVGAMLMGDTDAARTLVVVFSDGVDTASFTRPALALESARRVNGVVYGVSTGGDDVTFLQGLATATGGRVVRTGAAGDPGAAFLEVLREFRRRYVITFTPAGTPKSGWHDLAVRVNRRGAKVQARAGYFASSR